MVAAYFGYVVIASVVAMGRRPMIRTVFDLGYDFGPLVNMLFTSHVYASPDLFWTGHRMPLIPAFLALIAHLSTDAQIATIVKNLVWFSPLAGAFWLAWKQFANIPRLILLMVAGYLLSFPQLVQYGFLPDVEEGYLIPLLPLLFLGLLLLDRTKREPNWPAFLLLATMNAGLFLMKSSMLYLSLAFGLAFGLHTRRWRVLGLFLGLTLLAALLWGMLNLQHSGRFTVGSSYDGINFYKGNNPLAASMYPPYNLDAIPLDDLQKTAPTPLNEWTLNKHATTQAIQFIQTHSLDALQLFIGRLFIVFFEVRRTPIWPGEEQIAAPIQWVGILYMLAFRVAFFGVIGYAAVSLARRRRFLAKDARKELWLFICFLALVLMYTGPYLAGFAYERHVLPLIIPTIAYALWLLDRRQIFHLPMLLQIW